MPPNLARKTYTDAHVLIEATAQIVRRDYNKCCLEPQKDVARQYGRLTSKTHTRTKVIELKYTGSPTFIRLV